MTSIFSPISPRQFGPYQAAHLLWRAGFGVTWDEAEKLARAGLKATVDSLVDLSPAQDSGAPSNCTMPPGENEREFQKRLAGLSEPERQKLRRDRELGEQEKLTELRFWWLSRMLTTRRPLEEKMTLFWHSHFASAFGDKIRSAFAMWQQNELFRRNALTGFEDLTQKVVRDPTMLVWLDNANNVRGHANENLARELMELFTLGVGNYTEKDVQESARALTGNHVDRERWSFVFNGGAHDDGEKTFLGKTGNFAAEDIVKIICEQPACPRFITRKLLEFFVYENPETELIDEASALFRQQELHVGKFLGALFQSQLFYSAKAQNSVVKSPVVLTLGALKSFRVPVPEKNVLIDALRLMGQDLFVPPEVNGWPGGMAWINSNMLLIRYNFANFLLNGVSPDQFKLFKKETGSAFKRREFVEAQRTGKPIDWKPREQLRQLGIERDLVTGADVVDHYIRDFLGRPVSPDLREQFLAFAETDASGGKRSFSLTDSNFDERVRGLVHLIMSSPDYQLC
jgi:uncharacterized protein (DUF1800 family)